VGSDQVDSWSKMARSPSALPLPTVANAEDIVYFWIIEPVIRFASHFGSDSLPFRHSFGVFRDD
jgi:hypothetical protein